MGNSSSSTSKHDTESEEEGSKFTKPTGLYSTCDWDEKVVKKLIVKKRLAPRYPGKSEDDLGEGLEECPICMLFYPSVNRTRCCKKPVCTECFLQFKSEGGKPPSCPFCNEPSLAVIYLGTLTEEERKRVQEDEQSVIKEKIRAKKIDLGKEKKKQVAADDAKSRSRLRRQEDLERESQQGQVFREVEGLRSLFSDLAMEMDDDDALIGRSMFYPYRGYSRPGVARVPSNRRDDPMEFIRSMTRQREEQRRRMHSVPDMRDAQLHQRESERMSRGHHRTERETREAREARRQERDRARERARERERARQLAQAEDDLLQEALRQSLMYVDESGNPRSPERVDSAPALDDRVRNLVEMSQGLQRSSSEGAAGLDAQRHGRPHSARRVRFMHSQSNSEESEDDSSQRRHQDGAEYGGGAREDRLGANSPAVDEARPRNEGNPDEREAQPTGSNPIPPLTPNTNINLRELIPEDYYSSPAEYEDAMLELALAMSLSLSKEEAKGEQKEEEGNAVRQEKASRAVERLMDAREVTALNVAEEEEEEEEEGIHEEEIRRDDLFTAHLSTATQLRPDPIVPEAIPGVRFPDLDENMFSFASNVPPSADGASSTIATAERKSEEGEGRVEKKAEERPVVGEVEEEVEEEVRADSPMNESARLLE